MKTLFAILALIMIAGCATITPDQKQQIAESRTQTVVDENYSVLGNNTQARAEILSQYNY